jgi:hypothetical protein
VLENSVVRKIFGLKQHSVTEQFRRSEDKKRHEFCMLHSVLRTQPRYSGLGIYLKLVRRVCCLDDKISCKRPPGGPRWEDNTERAALEKGDWSWLWGVSSGRLWKYVRVLLPHFRDVFNIMVLFKKNTFI